MAGLGRSDSAPSTSLLTPPPSPQQGAAIIAALLVVALVAITATTLLARQSQALTRVQATTVRAQANSYSHTGLQWARGILAEDGKRGQVDHLGEAWARVLSALPVDDAMVSGRISDAQGRYNLNNLVRNNVASPADIQLFRRLLEQLGLNPDLAFATADWMDLDSDVNGAGGAEDAFYLAQRQPYRAANRPLQSVEELIRVRGFTSDAVNKLKPYVVALPALTRINLNTADDIVIAAAIPELDANDRARLLRDRQSKPFQDVNDIRQRLPKAPPTFVNEDLDVRTSYFTVTVAVAAGTSAHPIELASEALLKREGSGWPVIIRSRPL